MNLERSKKTSAWATRALHMAACLVLSLLLVPGQGAAQSGAQRAFTEAMRAETARLAADDRLLEAQLKRAYGQSISAEMMQIAKRNLRAIFGHPEFAARLADGIFPLYGAKASREMVQAASAEIVQQLQLRGMLRMPNEKIESFLMHMMGLMRALTPEACADFIDGNIDAETAGAIERYYMGSLPVEQFRAVSGLYVQAARHELDGYPHPRTLSVEQVRLAETVYEAATLRRLAASFTQEELQALAEDPAKVSRARYCEFGAQLILAMLDLKEPYRGWQFTSYLQSLQ